MSIQEASFTGFIKTLLIIALIYYGLKIIIRYIFPFFVKRTMEKMNERFREGENPRQPQKKVGETSIDKRPQPKKEKNNNTGEYIDYEEVE